MKAEILISIIKNAGFKIEMFGERLAVSPAELLTDEHRSMIRVNKSNLIDHFRKQSQIPAKMEEALTFEQLEADQQEAAQIYARHYLFPEPKISTEEMNILLQIQRLTVKYGYSIYKCTDAEQAGRFRQFLMHNLPIEFAALVVRDNDVNTYRETSNAKT